MSKDRDLSKMTKQELIEHAARLQAEAARLADQQSEVMVAVNTRLPRYLRDDLRKVASDQGTTLQSVIQDACQEWMDRHDEKRQQPGQ